MSDSDNESILTLPANDEIVARQYEIKTESDVNLASITNSPIDANTHKRETKESAEDKEEEYSDIFSSDEEMSKIPKILTARQMSMKDKKDNPKELNDWSILKKNKIDEKKLNWTSEQMLAHLEKTEKRKEFARSKAEQEKRQVVERLLKVNTDTSMNLQRFKGAGRSKFIRLNPNITDSESESSEPSQDDQTKTKEDKLLKLKRKEAAKAHGLSLSTADPPPGYVRVISSQRFPHSSILTYSTSMKLPLIATNSSPLARRITKCEIPGCSNSRAYTCRKTGIVLCSKMDCYRKASESNAIKT